VVRFKEVCGYLHTFAKLVSIPKWCDSKDFETNDAKVRITSFNSKVVRFKDGNESELCRDSGMFQFQSGAIQSLLNIYSDLARNVSIPKWCDSKFRKELLIMAVLGCFNSKVVRFKAWDFTPGSASSRFQFQSGAIQSKFANHIVHHFAKFQFQSGAIQSNARTKPSGYLPFVSIPKWCDSKATLSILLTTSNCFNSKVVRFKVN